MNVGLEGKEGKTHSRTRLVYAGERNQDRVRDLRSVIRHGHGEWVRAWRLDNERLDRDLNNEGKESD